MGRYKNLQFNLYFYWVIRMNRLMKSTAVILGLSLISITTNAATAKKRYIPEICYLFNSQGLLGEWSEQILVSKKELTFKQAAAYMQKNHGMSEIYDIDELSDIECSASIDTNDGEGSEIFHYKEPKPKAKTQAKPKAQAQQVKNASTVK